MGQNAYNGLHAFITDKMRMSHIYQPVMLRVLLENEGRASRNEIAKAFLIEDRSQIEYYEAIDHVEKTPSPARCRSKSSSVGLRGTVW